MTKDEYYMQMARAVSMTSKCKRAQYGCVIVSQYDIIIATGYNGKPRGCINDDICYRENLRPNDPKENCCLHSEENALLFSARDERIGGTLYVTGRPCNDCALMIMQSGVRRVVYLDRDSATGHPGTSTPVKEFWDKYGSGVEVVPMK